MWKEGWKNVEGMKERCGRKEGRREGTVGEERKTLRQDCMKEGKGGRKEGRKEQTVTCGTEEGMGGRKEGKGGRKKGKGGRIEGSKGRGIEGSK
jgi:hypothetical protein